MSSSEASNNHHLIYELTLSGWAERAFCDVLVRNLFDKTISTLPGWLLEHKKDVYEANQRKNCGLIDLTRNQSHPGSFVVGRSETSRRGLLA